MDVKNKAHAKQYFQKASNHDPLASLQDITENNHNNIRNDFISHYFVEPYHMTKMTQMKPCQFNLTTPYSEGDYDDDLSAGTKSVDQQRNYTTKSGRVRKIPEHLKNFEL